MLQYVFRVTGAYLQDGERRTFDREVPAETSGQAMTMVIGNLAWNCSILGYTFFLLDVNCDYAEANNED